MTAADRGPLDERYLERLAGRIGPGRLGAVVASFRSHAPARLAATARALADGDWAALADAAHALKGGAVAIGAPIVAEVAEAIERAARGGDAEAAAAAAKRLEPSLAAALRGLEAYGARRGGAEAPSLSS